MTLPGVYRESGSKDIVLPQEFSGELLSSQETSQSQSGAGSQDGQRCQEEESALGWLVVIGEVS